MHTYYHEFGIKPRAVYSGMIIWAPKPLVNMLNSITDTISKQQGYKCIYTNVYTEHTYTIGFRTGRLNASFCINLDWGDLYKWSCREIKIFIYVYMHTSCSFKLSNG